MELERGGPGLQLLRPDASEYHEARRTFNATIDRRPALIVRPATVQYVPAAVRMASQEGLPIAVRGGGHGVAGHAVADGAAVIDLARLRGVTIDPARRRARVEGGALWEDVDPAMTRHGLVFPGGTYGDTGVGGLTLGGGIGWLMGTMGLTCDSLVRAEVVTATGDIAIAGDGGDPELLWALRGGGGNFGVVAMFEFALHELPPLYAGVLDMLITERSLRALVEVQATGPPELEVMADISSVRDDESYVSLGICYQGTPSEAEHAIAPLREAGVERGALSVMSYEKVQEMNGRLPFGLRHYWKGHFVGDASGDDDFIDTILRVVADQPVGTRADLLIEALHGSAREEPAGGAAFGQRGARWNVSALGIWDDPGRDAEVIDWVRRTVEGFAPWSLSGAGYGNYAPVDETPERVLAAFGRERFKRLQRVKARYDPDNRFRFNHNIPPAAAE
jgi:FAD/FMN-containing dehydrogenase